MSIINKQYNYVASCDVLWKPFFVTKFKVNPKNDYKVKYNHFRELNNFLHKTIRTNVVSIYNGISLYLNNKFLQVIPIHMGVLEQLQFLYLNNNNLVSLPKEIGQLTNLQRLDVNNNKIGSVPDELYQLTQLHTLFLCNNEICELSPQIGQLTNLQVMGLNGNCLAQLPETIGQLTNLVALNLGTNPYNGYSESIGQLTNLITLTLQHGCEIIPESIKCLTQLKELGLDSTQVPYAPKNMSAMKYIF